MSATHRPGTVGTAALAVAVAGLLVGCSALREVRGGATTTGPTTTPATTTTTVAPTTTSGAATTTTVPLPYPLPRVGACRGAVAEEDPVDPVDQRDTVPCTSPHGSETVAVLASALVAVDDHPARRQDVPEGLAERAALECQRAFDAYVGLSPIGSRGRASSRLVPAWFVPSPQDWDLGARWVRCEAVVAPVEGEPGTFAGTLRGALSGDEVPAPLVACYDRELRRTRCDAAHAYEAVVDAAFEGAQERPDDDAVSAARVEQCDTAAAAAIGVGSMAEQPSLVTELLLPTAREWAAGRRLGTCVVAGADGRDLGDSVRGLESTPPLFTGATTSTTVR